MSKKFEPDQAPHIFGPDLGLKFRTVCKVNQQMTLASRVNVSIVIKVQASSKRLYHCLCKCSVSIVFPVLFASGDFANSLDPDYDRLNVHPDLDPNCLTRIVFLKEYFEKVDFEKSADDKSTKNYQAFKDLKYRPVATALIIVYVSAVSIVFPVLLRSGIY